ncbi:DNA-protecting protein DprA [bacterium D16-51]|nr:DNA-protecting protein DprA [bacterium D16-59]RKI61917.1 DNA-protecting protein DprA [bacterium D16-51]
MDEKMYAFWLCNIKGIGSQKIKSLLGHFGSPEEVFLAKGEQFLKFNNLRQEDREHILSSRNPELLKKQYDSMQKRGIHFVSWQEKAYPEKLKCLNDAPYGLYYKGRLPGTAAPCVAVVGARDASFEGKGLAEKFGCELAQNGIQVISGMARGIDISAQRGVLKTPRGRAYSVLGTGVDICYPRQHIEDYMMMQENGGVISEFPLKTPPLPYHFPMRNRLISAFSDGILVIEAGNRSGSLITAEQGLEQGKEIFVIPGNIMDSKYDGSNELLKNGAVLATSVRDILDGLGLFFDRDVIERKKKSEVMLETAEKIVYAMLSLEPVHLAQIAEETGMELPRVMEILLSLQIKNLVQAIGNNYFMIKL